MCVSEVLQGLRTTDYGEPGLSDTYRLWSELRFQYSWIIKAMNMMCNSIIVILYFEMF